MKPIYTFVFIFLLLNIGKSQMKHAEIAALANYPGALLQDLNLKNGDRSFTLQPDTIIISNFENELQNRKVTYVIQYEDDKIHIVDFEVFHINQGIIRIYYDYKNTGSLYQTRFYSLKNGNEEYYGKVHYNYDSDNRLISYIDYDKDNLVGQGDSLLIEFDGNLIKNYTHFIYNTETFKWDADKNISQIVYNNGDIQEYQLIQYYSINNDIFQDKFKLENTRFIPGAQNRLFTKIDPYYIYDSTNINTSILSPTNGSDLLITGPSGFDKWYFNENLQQYTLSEKTKLSSLNNDYVVSYYNIDDTSMVLGTRTYYIDAQSKLTKSLYMSSFGSEENNFQYNIHDRIEESNYLFNNNLVSHKVFSYQIDDDGRLIEYTNNELNTIAGTFRDEYYFGYKEGSLKRSINEDQLLTIFPNPATDCILVKDPTISIEKNTSLKLINISGQILKDIKLSLDQTLIDISFLTAGIYIVQIYDGSNFRVTKFIKN